MLETLAKRTKIHASNYKFGLTIASLALPVKYVVEKFELPHFEVYINPQYGRDV